MNVLNVFPPNYREINAAFKVRGKPVIFCFGATIYNPCRIKVPPQLMVHEAVHSRQQGTGPESWWARYIADPAFRLEQEIEAHRAECRSLVETGMPLAQAIDMVASRLAAPLYGGIVTYQDARTIIADYACEFSAASAI